MTRPVPPMPTALRAAMLGTALLLAACGPSPEEQRAAEQAAAAEREAAAEVVGKAFDEAMAAGNLALARAEGDRVLREFAGTKVAARIKPLHAEVVEKDTLDREQRRTAALWSYGKMIMRGAPQTTASIYAKETMRVKGGQYSSVRLIFRDHKAWGRSSYLVLEGGDFDCYGGCQVQVTFDDQPPRTFKANRPATDEAIAMFIGDGTQLWKAMDGARVMTVEVPLKELGKRKAVFEVAGVDRARMPGW